MGSSAPLEMDKFSLNKMIVAMRADVQRAKTRTINKLTREAKNLKAVKPGQPALQSEKRKLKADRLIEELLIIKKLVNDDVSKLAFVSTEARLIAERSNPSSTLQQRALARLASNPLLVKSVKEFREQNPTWQATVPSLIDSLGVKVKRKKKQFVNTNVQQSDISAMKHSDKKCEDIIVQKAVLEQETEDENDEIGIKKIAQKNKKESKGEDVEIGIKQIAKKNKKESKGEDVEIGIKQIAKKNKKESKGEDVELEVKKKVKKNTETHKNTMKNETGKEIKVTSKAQIQVTNKGSKERKVESKDKTTVPKSTKKSKFEKLSKPFSKQSNVMKVARFSEIVSDGRATLVDEEPPVSMAKTVDSFFVSEDGKSDYLSTVASKEVTERTDIPSQKYDRMREMYFNKYGRVPNRRELRSREQQGVHYIAAPVKTRDWSRPSRSEANVAVKKEMVVESVVESVHPSWEAKRKQKEMLSSAFQGKKIKFDDA